MFIYCMHKIPQNDLKKFEGKTKEEIYAKYCMDETRVIYVDEKDYDKYGHLYNDLKPYLMPVMLKYTSMNKKKFKKDYNLPPDAHIVNEMSDGDMITFFLSTEKYENFTVKLSKREFNEKYMDEKLKKTYVAYAIEKRYMRDWYNTMDIIRANVKDLKAGGYYKISKKFLNDLYVADYSLREIKFVDNTREALFFMYYSS